MTRELVRMSDWMKWGVAAVFPPPPHFDYGYGLYRIDFGDWRYPNGRIEPRSEMTGFLPAGSTPSAQVQAGSKVWDEIAAHLAEADLRRLT